jgi:predicted dehydrogenase
VDTIDVGVIGTGWCGRIRAATAAASPLVGNVHVAEIRRDRLAEAAAMEATHDIDFLLWCLSPARPVLVYAQAADGIMRTKYEGRTPCGSS